MYHYPQTWAPWTLTSSSYIWVFLGTNCPHLGSITHTMDLQTFHSALWFLTVSIFSFKVFWSGLVFELWFLSLPHTFPLCIAYCIGLCGHLQAICGHKVQNTKLSALFSSNVSLHWSWEAQIDKRHSLSRLVWKNLGGLHRSITSTPWSTFGIHWNSKVHNRPSSAQCLKTG